MVAPYVPEAGDIVVMDFDPQVGREQAKRLPALVLTDQRYNRASGLAVVCPLTGKRKPYPFALPVTVEHVEGAVLVDQLKTMDWAVLKAKFRSRRSLLWLAKCGSTWRSYSAFAEIEEPKPKSFHCFHRFHLPLTIRARDLL